MTRVCVVGSVNMDVVFTVDTLPGPGATVLASSLTRTPGGKGGNQAVAAARAGAEVTMVAAVGADDAGAALVAHLQHNNVDTSAVRSLPMPSGIAGIVVDAEAENTIVVAPGANAHLFVDALPAADVLLLQLEIPLPTALAAARIARAAGTLVMVNASPLRADMELTDLAEAADVVIVNETEARSWRWPVADLVITMGARGARHGDAVVAAPVVEPVDTTGAGDVFAGVLATGWPTGPHRALRRACAAGALATLVPGAGDCAPTAEAVDDALN